MNATTHNGPVYSTWRFLKLMVGNSRKYNCKTKGYKNKIGFAMMTLYIMLFTAGLFLGDLSITKAIEIEKIFGLVTTAIIYGMGSSVIYTACIGHGSKLPAMVSGVVIATQTAFVFNLFPLPVVNILYYMGSLVTMVFVYTVAHREKYKNYGTEKRQ